MTPDQLEKLDFATILPFIMVILVFLLIMYIIESLLMMRFYKNMNYNHAWFAWLPIVSSYIQFKLVYDAYYFDKKLQMKNDFSRYADDRRGKVISGLIILIIVSAILGALSSLININDIVMTNNENIKTTINIIDPMSIIISLVISTIVYYAALKLARKTNEPFNQKSTMIKAILWSLANTVTLGVANIIFWAIANNNIFVNKDQFYGDNKHVTT